MDFILFFDLYEDWKQLTFTKELYENIVRELKRAWDEADRAKMKGGE